MSNIEDTANDLLHEFGNDSETTSKVTRIQTSDPYVELKMNLLSFFKDRMSKITAQERLKEQVEQALELQLEGGDLSFEQILSLYRLVSTQNNASSDSLLSLFKPTPGAPSILADNLGRQEEDKNMYDEMYEDFSSDQLQALDNLGKILTSLNKKKPSENKAVNDDDV